MVMATGMRTVTATRVARSIVSTCGMPRTVITMQVTSTMAMGVGTAMANPTVISALMPMRPLRRFPCGWSRAERAVVKPLVVWACSWPYWSLLQPLVPSG